MALGLHSLVFFSCNAALIALKSNKCMLWIAQEGIRNDIHNFVHAIYVRFANWDYLDFFKAFSWSFYSTKTIQCWPDLIKTHRWFYQCRILSI